MSDDKTQLLQTDPEDGAPRTAHNRQTDEQATQLFDAATSARVGQRHLNIPKVEEEAPVAAQDAALERTAHNHPTPERTVARAFHEDSTGAPASQAIPTERLAQLSHGAAPQRDDDPYDDAHRRRVGGDAPGEGRSRSVGRALLAAFIVIAAVAGIASFAAYGAELWGGKSVPRVAGKAQAAAVALLEEKGFAVEVEERLVDSSAGMAIETDPAAGERVEKGTTVKLYVGAARIIPEVSGLSLADARAALDAVGAQNITITYTASDAEEGTVVSVEPAPGSTFTSSEEVTITVAQPYTVPYVIGKTEQDAVKDVEAAGLVATVKYVNSGSAAGTVVETSPSQGERIGQGETVTLSVSAPQPSDVLHIMEYVGADARGLSALLAEKGFAVDSSSIVQGGKLRARYESRDYGTLIFTGTPFTSHYVPDGDDKTDYLAEGRGFDGVRLELAQGLIPAGTSELTDSALKSAISLFGFSGLTETVTLQSARLPEGVSRGSRDYVCAFGQMGDNCWTILMTTRNGQPFVAATAGPRALYSDYDLSPYGGSICSMVAYIEMYTG